MLSTHGANVMCVSVSESTCVWREGVKQCLSNAIGERATDVDAVAM